MKKTTVALVAMSLITTSALGASKIINKSTTELSAKKNLATDSVHKGLRVSFGGSKTRFDFETRVLNLKETQKLQTDSTAIAIGYEDIKLKEFGYSGTLTRIVNSVRGISINQNMLEGNVTYGFTPQIHVFGGGNFSSLQSEADTEPVDLFDDLGIGIGLQLGAGVQLSKKIALELKYVTTFHTVQYDAYYEDGTKSSIKEDVDLITSALRLGVVGTF
ncbi:MAG: hypothetical protein HON90_18125 [Halobacteriovoraceae bacterium]|jgi:hypothetical protein|nr:hypothetical protein [Halobacteriovoraceae bacterium]